MIDRIIPLLNRVVPTALAFKGLQKLDPRIGRFFTQAQEKGFGQDDIMEFMRNEFEGGGKHDQRLRPDERSSQQQISHSQSQGKTLGNVARTGASIAGAAGLGALGSLGLDALSSMIGGNEGEQEQSNQTDDQRSLLAGPNSNPTQEDAIQDFIQQFPEIGNAVLRYIQGGHPPEVAAQQIKQTNTHKQKIQELEQKSGIDFVDLITRLFGSPKQQGGSRPSQPVAQQNQGQQQGGDIQNQIKAAINKIMQM